MTDIEKVEIVQMIKVTAARGTGIKEDPVRQIKQYWDFDGNLIAEKDNVQYKNFAMNSVIFRPQ